MDLDFRRHSSLDYFVGSVAESASHLPAWEMPTKYWLAVLVAAVTSLSIIDIGLIVACFSKTVSQAFVIANSPLGFLMFLTGATLPCLICFRPLTPLWP